ncbi:MAG: zinc-dependent metalloprotease [Nitriliruptoraceae bacterium]
MSDVPDRPGGNGDEEDPFADLPPELRAMLEQLGGPEALQQAQEQLAQLFGQGGFVPGFGPASGPTAGQPSGPVDWDLATRVALQVAAEGDREPTEEERRRAEEAFGLAEHWLDATPLPAAPDAGQLVVSSRQGWVNAAVTALAPLVEPVARASTDALASLAREQLQGLDEQEGLEALGGMFGEQGLPPGFDQMLRQLLSQDPGELIRPAAAAMSGLQAGQVVGKLARQLFGQYDLGVPTAPREQAHHLAVNITEDLEGYDLDPTEVAIVLALTEAAHRRLYHAVPWLEAHVASLVARFAAGTQVDAEQLQQLADEVMTGVDPEDPESLQRAMEQAADFRLTPTEEQRRVLDRLQGVVSLVGAWARHEVARAVEDRLPSLDRIEEVLRRRRAVKGDGEALLESLLGLDIKPDDETIGERFILAVEDALGAQGLHQALAHPENLPDGEELADPSRWLARVAEDAAELPDDLQALFEGLGEAPHEASADERLAEHDDDPGDEDPGRGDDPQPGDG